jgi:uncharacterized membrane protein YjgN (DUF898 family)
MVIQFDCHGCGKSLKTEDQQAGKSVQCPACGQALVIPSASPAAAAEAPQPASSGQAAIGVPCSFQFTGTGGGLLSETFIGLILTIVTFGLYSPWFICRMTRWNSRHTNLNDRQGNTVTFSFSGTGGKLFVDLIIGWLLTIITLGIYGFWYYVNMFKFFVENSDAKTPDGRPVKATFTGTGGQLFGEVFVGMLLTIVTVGIYSPWFICKIIGFFYNNTVISVDGSKALTLKFTGTGGDLFVTFIVGYLLTIVTLGIYQFWFQVNLMKFTYGNTEVSTQNGSRFRVNFNGTGGELFGIHLVGIIVSIVTLGIYSFWFSVNLIKFQTDHLEVVDA